MLDKVIYKKLNAKLVDIMNYKSKTELEKKALVGGMNEEIKAAREKCKTLAKVISDKDLELMYHCGLFDENELNELLGTIDEIEELDI